MDSIGVDPAPAGVTQCDQKKLSDSPLGLFQNVWTKFCNEANAPKSALSWITDIDGNKITPKALVDASRQKKKRSPPPDKDQYKDYRLFLQWQPTESGEECWSSCGDVFYSLANECAYGTYDKHMPIDGSIDVGCGTYSYHIEAAPEQPKPAPLALGEQKCNPREKGNTSPFWQDYWAKWICNQKPVTSYAMAYDNTAIQWTPSDNTMNYRISWVAGCTTTVDSQSPLAPVEGTNCYTLLIEDYKKCDNGG